MSSAWTSRVVLPCLGIASVLVLWALVSQLAAPDLPGPLKTWTESRRYVVEPFFKDGEMNQGIGRLAFYSLVRVGKGYLLAIAIGTPLGFLLGLSRGFHQSFRWASWCSRSRSRPPSSPSRCARCGPPSSTPRWGSGASIRTI